jgi:cytochrome c oxidase subunit 3/cytochrome o ubiquinol oxidase subunit 3
MISTFLLNRNSTGDGPGAEIFNIPFTSASSFILLMSSVTMVLADNAFQRKDQRQGRVWLIGTILLGLTFLAGRRPMVVEEAR